MQNKQNVNIKQSIKYYNITYTQYNTNSFPLPGWLRSRHSQRNGALLKFEFYTCIYIAIRFSRTYTLMFSRNKFSVILLIALVSHMPFMSEFTTAYLIISVNTYLGLYFKYILRSLIKQILVFAPGMQVGDTDYICSLHNKTTGKQLARASLPANVIRKSSNKIEDQNLKGLRSLHINWWNI